MLKLQEYLRNGGTLEGLKEELKINWYKHPELPLVGFKYRIDANKFNPIVAEARGIVLEIGTWNLVAKAFNRFYRPVQDPTGFAKFDWSDFEVMEKVDGSLIILYYYDLGWNVNTSGSFGKGFVGESGRSWQSLFEEVSEINPIDLYLFKNHTFVFELCTKWNKVVRSYPTDKVFLLSVFEGENEFQTWYVDKIAKWLNVPRPPIFSFKTLSEINEYFEYKATTDPTWEGVVIRKCSQRWKIKAQPYDDLHALKGDDGFTSSKIIRLILNGNIDVVLMQFPEYSEEVVRINRWLEDQYSELEGLAIDAGSIESAKEFALFILPRTKFSSVLFNSRNKKTDLRSAWIDAVDLITKVYQNDNNR